MKNPQSVVIQLILNPLRVKKNKVRKRTDSNPSSRPAKSQAEKVHRPF